MTKETKDTWVATTTATVLSLKNYTRQRSSPFRKVTNMAHMVYSQNVSEPICNFT